MTDDALHITAFGSACRFEVHAKPKAKTSAIVSVVEGRLEVAIAAQPNDGAANDELVRFLAKTLNLKDILLAFSAQTTNCTDICV